jgi:hypothetical protein
LVIKRGRYDTHIFPIFKPLKIKAMTQKEIKKASLYNLEETLDCMYKVENLLSRYCHVIDENDNINEMVKRNILNIITEIEQREENYYNLITSKKLKP